MRFFPDPLPPLVPHPLSLSFSPTNYNFVYIIRNRILHPLSRDSLSRDFRSLRKRISAPLFPREIGLPTSAYFHLDLHFFSASESGRLARYYAGNRSSRVTRKRNISDIRRHCSSGISLSYFPPSSSFSPFLSLSLIQKFDVYPCISLFLRYYCRVKRLTNVPLIYKRTRYQSEKLDPSNTSRR